MGHHQLLKGRHHLKEITTAIESIQLKVNIILDAYAQKHVFRDHYNNLG